MLRLLRSFGTKCKSYLVFPGNLSEATIASLVYLSKLPKDSLSQSIDIFRDNVLPPDSRAQVPQIYAEIFKTGSPEETIPISFPQQNTFDELFNRLEHLKRLIKYGKTLDLKPRGVYEALKVITEFCDKGKVGFLTGDLDYNLIELIMNHMSYIETDPNEDNSEIYAKIEEFILQGEFCLPANGIKHSSHENPQAMFIRELQVERDSAEIIINKARNDVEALTHGTFGLNYLTPKENLMKLFLPLCRQIRVEQEQCVKKDLNQTRERYAKVLVKCPADKLAMVTLSSILKAAAPHIRETEEGIELKYTNLVSQIGNDVQKQIKEDKTDALFTDFKKKRSEERKAIIKDEKIIRNMLRNELKGLREEFKFTGEELCEAGAILLKLLMQTAQVNTKSETPAITHELQTQGNTKKKTVGMVKISKEFISMLMGKVADRKNEINIITLERTLPMIAKPSRWTDWETGGYLQRGYPIMRLQGSKVQKTALERADLSRICEVLNIMGDTPWRINSRVLDVVEKLYNIGGGVGEIPVLDDGKQFRPHDQMTFLQKQKLNQEKRDNWSLLNDFEIKLGIARKFKEVDRFYMPLNLDFRGRIYPISPHLNQIGNDISRGLLEFAEGKKLQTSGLKWLKIHLANKMGYDKLPMEDRVKVTEDLMADVFEIANDPIKNRAWLGFEDPWQSLATIFDLTEALRSSNPDEYVSHLHIHQDGSCNGLQHYAALGRDIEGAEQVNLSDREKPGDVYSAVSRRVQETVNRDANNGNRIAGLLVDKIKRKIVKQTVMTSVYGVTFIGARDQIKKQLQEFKLLPEEDLLPGAIYLAGTTMAALDNVFSGGQRIKAWLVNCAGIIAKAGYPVSWLTPLGLPVVQPYRRGSSTMFIDTVFQRVTLTSNKDHLPVSVPKQKSAFPPNFVHSLDSTHLMLTAVECYKEGIEFAAVHDSFWTHACNIDRMNKILRHQFLNLHSQPLLDELLEGFRCRFPKLKFQDVPQRGEFDLKKVLDSTYFFA